MTAGSPRVRSAPVPANLLSCLTDIEVGAPGHTRKIHSHLSEAQVICKYRTFLTFTQSKRYAIVKENVEIMCDDHAL
jgi:hypothetical protein